MLRLHHKQSKVKCCIYIAPFPYGYAQRRITMISLPPADRKHIKAHLAATLMWSMHAGTHFTDLGRMESWVNFSGKEGHRYSTLNEAGDWTWDLRVGRQRSYHCPTPLLYKLYSAWCDLGWAKTNLGFNRNWTHDLHITVWASHQQHNSHGLIPRLFFWLLYTHQCISWAVAQ